MEKDFEPKRKFEEAVNAVLRKKKPMKETANLYGITYTTLRSQIRTFKRSGKETYKYEDKSRMFTDEDEQSLLEQFKQETLLQSECICTSCSKKRMRKRAYQFAKKNNITCSNIWMEKKEASKGWLAKFEKRHKIKISDLFPLNDCLLRQSLVNQSQPSSFDTENVSGLPCSSKDLQDDNFDTSSNCNDSIYINMEKDFESKRKFEEAVNAVLHKKKTVVETANLYGIPYTNLQYQIKTFKRSGKKTYKYEDKNRIFTEENEQSLLEQFKQETLLKSECICTSCSKKRMRKRAYQFAKKNNITCTNIWMEKKQATRSWLERFEKRHKIKISDLFPLNDCLLHQSLVNQSQPSSFDTENVSGLPCSSKDLQDDNFDTSSNCNDSIYINMEKDFEPKRKFEEAVNAVLHKKKTMIETANLYGIPYTILKSQINTFKRSGKETYKYGDKKQRIFTDEDEQSLLEEFKHETLLQSECICTLCSKKRMRKRAYQFAKKNNITCSNIWMEKKEATRGWLERFEKRHKIKISDLFPLNDCLLRQSLVNQSQPSSFDIENVSGLPCSSKDLQDDNSDTSSNCNKIFTQTTSETCTIVGYNQLEDPNEIIPEREEIIKEETTFSVFESDQPLDLRIVSKQRENS